MENKLTNEEIAKVFAMYLGCPVLDSYDSDKPHTLFGVDLSSNEPIFILHKVSKLRQTNEVKLLLTPLSLISDEDAIDLYNIFGITENEAGYNTSITAIKNCCIKDGFFALALFDFYGSITYVHQYLISKGYAVPLFFGVNHWANGMDAISLNIAIDKTKL